MFPWQSLLVASVGALGQMPHPERKGGSGTDVDNVAGGGDSGIRAHEVEVRAPG